MYASPYLKARPGSTHGYDVIDHCSLNPELGTKADYDTFCDELAKHGMSQIDIAKELNVNKSTVCRALQKARETGALADQG